MPAVATDESCWASSFAAGEPLAGTATRADRWLLVEVPGAWARDVDETELSDDLRAAVDGFDGRVQLIRRPDRRGAETVAFLAESREDGGTLRRLPSLADLETAEPVEGLLVLVCCHGRRDPCCARLGTPVFDALRGEVADESLWQSSHLGGHRFAANVLVLPSGILLGRVAPADVVHVAAEIAARRIPLEHYRGRTIHPPAVQAADAAVRRELDLAALEDVRLVEHGDSIVRLDTRLGPVAVTVEKVDGPLVAASCGEEPEASSRFVVRTIER